MRVELARPEDEPEVRALFRTTLLLGRPLPFADRAPALVAAYERLCLDPYLAPGSPTIVGVLRETPSGRVRGYALVCLDAASLRPHRSRGLAAFVARATPWLAPRGDATTFVRSRFRDGWALRRPARAVRDLPHTHFNAAPGTGRLPGRLLADFVDDVCRAGGHPSWYGEINARVGRRGTAITAWWGGEIVDRTPNRTLSRMLGVPVERLTVVRTVPPADAEQPAA
jgi:hypothetical protein